MTNEPIRKALMAVLVLPGVDDATRDVKELAAAALADLDRVTRERDEALKGEKSYQALRDGSGWPAVFASSDAPEPLRGEELDAAIAAKAEGSAS